ncbi:D-2-hydroxyacid dehydrogenase [Cohnella nanjingensis]|uniref:D-2-hydroxyacid dehydrogenase n=1 Tax=Cohnella nanjingensis TaxID=1387779 RepID=A0A7X0RZT0_9BACL|nr:D-2-hydroxyacid dehydrogenase [Cohnella nanjingensis]MBB6675315.1 D-2-hydroxyacid dehydrogenase [Cohnella nanjingensis]
MRTLVSLFGFTPEQEQQIRESAPGWNVVFGKPRELDAALFREAEVVCGWWPAVASEGLKPDAKLRWVQTGSAGVDNLPLTDLERRGVILTTASGIHPIPMTETVFAMLLAFSRKLHHAIRRQVEGRWERAEGYGELRGLTIAIVGAGEIGAETARIAQAFGMRTLGIRRSGRPAQHFDRMYAMDALDEVLGQSDIVVNILPHTEETVRVFDAERFARMKPTSLFINIGRGTAVDTEALTEALRGGTIAGAGLDVFEPEPLPEGHPLWAMDNVILTPHIGGATEAYKQRMADLFAANLTAYISDGRPARNIVEYSRSY